METKSLFEMLIESGYPREDIHHWYSDMYVSKNSSTSQVIDDWIQKSGIKRDLFVDEFKDNVTGESMYEIKFAYVPYWKEIRNGHKKNA